MICLGFHELTLFQVKSIQKIRQLDFLHDPALVIFSRQNMPQFNLFYLSLLIRMPIKTRRGKWTRPLSKVVVPTINLLQFLLVFLDNLLLHGFIGWPYRRRSNKISHCTTNGTTFAGGNALVSPPLPNTL